LTRDEGPHHLALESHACVRHKQMQSIGGGDGGERGRVRSRGNDDDDDDDGAAGVNCVFCSLSSRWMSTEYRRTTGQLSCNERLKGGALLETSLLRRLTLSCTVSDVGVCYQCGWLYVGRARGCRWLVGEYPRINCRRQHVVYGVLYCGSTRTQRSESHGLKTQPQSTTATDAATALVTPTVVTRWLPSQDHCQPPITHNTITANTTTPSTPSPTPRLTIIHTTTTSNLTTCDRPSC
jgi:hypothetical protein